jgi:outer membrane protein TolC
MNKTASCLLPILAFLLGTEASICAEGLTLREFILRFGESDKGLAASGLRVDAARGTKAGEGYLPFPSLEFDLRAPYRSWGRSYQYEAYKDRTYLGYYEYREESYRVQLGLNQDLPSGGRLSLRGIGRRAQSDFEVGGFPTEIAISRETGDEEFLMDVGLSLDQPLFGPWDKKDAARAASLKYRKQKAQYKTDSAETVKQAINLFFDFLAGLLKVEEARLELDLADAAARAADTRLEAGLISEIEYLEKSISANDARISFRNAVSSVEAIRMKTRMLTPADDRELLPENLFAAFPLEPTGPSRTLSPEVLQAEHERDLARISLAQTERKRFGQSTLSFWYGLEGLGDTFEESRDLFRHNRWGGYLSLHFLFPEPGLGAEIELARANLNIAQAAYEDAVRKVEERRDLILEEIRTHGANAELQVRRNHLLENLIEIKRDQSDTGIINPDDLLEAEVGLIQAKVDHLETLRRLNVAWVDMALLYGLDPIAVLNGETSGAE